MLGPKHVKGLFDLLGVLAAAALPFAECRLVHRAAVRRADARFDFRQRVRSIVSNQSMKTGSTASGNRSST